VKAGYSTRELRLGSASHPAIIVGKGSRKADALLAPNQNIENNPMQSGMVSRAWIL
jgi:hypothetical protein